MPSDLILPPRREIEAQRARAVCLSWRPQRSNTLRGFADIGFPNGLVLCDITVHEGHGKRWVAPAGIPVLDADRRRRQRPDGRGGYRPSARFAHSDARERFKMAVLAALEDAGVGPFDEPEG